MGKFFAGGKTKKASYEQPQVRVANSAYHKLLLKRIIAIMGYAVLAAFVIYLCLASTIMRVVPTTSGAGPVPVKANTNPGGMINEGQTILASLNKEQKDGYLERLSQAFVPANDAVLMEVVAGPNNKIKWVESGIVVVDGKITKAHLQANPKSDLLRGEYLGVRVSGACDPGEGLIVKKSNIYGVSIVDHNSSVSEK